MVISAVRCRAAAAAFYAVVVLAPAVPAAAAQPDLAPVRPDRLPEPPDAADARAELSTLTIAGQRSMDGYSRARFPHWAQQGANCDTREVVLARDGSAVRQDDRCRAVGGLWISEYDGAALDAASQVDIDHMVPPANAWRSGADAWDQDKRKKFANDLTDSQLIAVSATSNRSKADQGPDEWKPPLRSYWCTYGRAWTDVKYGYGLTVTEMEKSALQEMLDTCLVRGRSLPEGRMPAGTPHEGSTARWAER